MNVEPAGVRFLYQPVGGSYKSDALPPPPMTEVFRVRSNILENQFLKDTERAADEAQCFFINRFDSGTEIKFALAETGGAQYQRWRRCRKAPLLIQSFSCSDPEGFGRANFLFDCSADRC